MSEPSNRAERESRWRTMDLTAIGRETSTDKATRHRFTQQYERHLGHLRDEEFTLFEIGIGGSNRPGRGGASLRMWKRFFANAHVVGLDIVDKSFVEAPRITVYTGDQTDAALLTRIVEETGPVLVVVDDGSHRPEHVRATFRALFPLVSAGGFYAIEDTQTSYWPRWGGSADRQDPTTTMALVKDLIDGLNWVEFLDDGYEPTYADRWVSAVHCYHNLVIIEKGLNEEWTNKHRIA